MKNWIYITDVEDKYVLNLEKVVSIQKNINCVNMKYILFRCDNGTDYIWNFESNEECDQEYFDLMDRLTNENFGD